MKCPSKNVTGITQKQFWPFWPGQKEKEKRKHRSNSPRRKPFGMEKPLLSGFPYQFQGSFHGYMATIAFLFIIWLSGKLTVNYELAERQFFHVLTYNSLA